MISETATPSVQATTTQLLARRLEFKYVIDRTTRTALCHDLERLMRPDSHSGQEGGYWVRSLYLDTPNYQAYHEKLAGSATRHKLRVRAYGDDPGQSPMVRLEIKSRHLNFIHKTTIDVSRDDYADLERSLLRRTLPGPRWLDNPAVPKEFFRLQKQHNMEAKVLVQYRRLAFERAELGRVRVNFDDELVASTQRELLAPLTGARRLLRYGHAVFEIKVDGHLPVWLHTLIAKYNLQHQAFSKYCHAVRSLAHLSPTCRVI